MIPRGGARPTSTAAIHSGMSRQHAEVPGLIAAAASLVLCWLPMAAESFSSGRRNYPEYLAAEPVYVEPLKVFAALFLGVCLRTTRPNPDSSSELDPVGIKPHAP